MRQAGRFLPEYRALRAKHDLLELCHEPELAAQVTLLPVARLNVDAAIIFADILLPFEPLGLGLSFTAGERGGPHIAHPIRDAARVAALPRADPERELSYVLAAVRLAAQALPPGVPLIGFAGAPFTLASYAIEGGGSRSFTRTKRFMHGEPAAWHALLGQLADLVGRYLAAQAGAGARALQLFDSWVGCLSPADYREYVLPHVQLIFEGLKREGVPLIHFGTGTATLLKLMREAGGDVIGVDWRVRLDEAWATIGYDVAIQGNLDPVLLFAPLHEIERRVEDILRRAAGRPGHIFNLGHGILPNTPVEHVAAVVELVHKLSQR